MASTSVSKTESLGSNPSAPAKSCVVEDQAGDRHLACEQVGGGEGCCAQ
jgi:hypothetical protein